MLWLIFAAGVAVVLVIDLRPWQRSRAAAPSLRHSAVTCASVGLLTAGFGALLAYTQGRAAALQFLAGFLIEEGLSVDNLFVFLLIFESFAIPAALQPRVLFWGIFGALALRALAIAAGVALIHAFAWLFYVFGVVLLITGIRLATTGGGADRPPQHGLVVRLYRRVVPSTLELHGERFWVREAGKRRATPLLLVLFLVEISDIVFALDSIPAIFAVTTNPLLVYTSNVCAILGLRAMYFLLAKFLQSFVYLRYGLALVLCFIGVKMLVQEVYPIGIGTSLLVIFSCLAVTILGSLWRKAAVISHQGRKP